MRMKTTILPLAGILALAMMVAACGSTASIPGSGAAPTATVTTAATANNLPIKAATVTVKGTAMSILTTAGGLTLYYRTTDSGTSVFQGSAWPPLLSVSGATTGTGLSGTLGVLNDNNGAQVTYNGHPLYLYASDSAPGDANGQGIGNIWFVVTPDIAKATNSGGNETPPPGGGYGH